MTDLNIENMKNQQSTSEPSILSHGIGLDLNDIKMLLAMKHETHISNDDPILMLVTICNGFIGELEKLNQKHNNALTEIMGEQMTKYVGGVKETTDSLATILADSSLSAIRKTFYENSNDLLKYSYNNRWCAGIVVVSALVNVAALAILRFM